MKGQDGKSKQDSVTGKAIKSGAKDDQDVLMTQIPNSSSDNAGG